MIEDTVLEFLAARLDVPVKAEVPAPMPDTFVTVEKTGGSRENWLWHATLAVQSYGRTLLQAARLDDTVIEAMTALPTLDGVGACKLVRDYNFTDTESKQYRYQAVFEITYY